MSLFHIGSELRRFGHGKLPPLTALVIVLIPLLFGGLFVWSYWDPVGRLNNMPVAVVNSDEGTTVAGREVHAGDQIVSALLNNDKVNFIEVDADDAKKGIDNGTYYFGIELPTDFSAAAVSANTETPHQATLNAVYNNNNGFLATMLGNQVVAQVLATINENLGSQVATQLLVGFNTINGGVHAAGAGATQLSEGTGAAREGSQQLAQGSGSLEQGIAQTNDGAHSLAAGAGELSENIAKASAGADQLADGLAQLNQATEALGNGADQVSRGVNQVTGIANRAHTTQEQLLGMIVNLSAQLRSTGIPQAVDLANQADGLVTQLRNNGISGAIMSQLDQLSDGAQQVNEQLTSPVSKFRQGMDAANTGAQQLATGLHELNDGSQRLVIGANTLADGTSRLLAGSQQLTVGASQLSSGLVQLDEGSAELALKLNENADKIPTFSADRLGAAALNVTTPVGKHMPGDSLSLFGEGLAPMFICIGLFVGGTVCFMIVRPLQRRAIESCITPIRVALASYLPAAILGLAQATVVFLVQRFFIGLHAAHEWALWLAMCAISLTFMALAQALNSIFGATVGRVLCIGFMTLQVVSSGGLYPPETQPAPLRWFHTYDPMTYGVNLLRHAINGVDGIDDSRVVQALGALVLIWIICFSVTTLSALRERQMKIKDLHPEVAV
ncbi:YhgE/Pip domain-containing protein [Corynebacterium sp. sy017]|uniref:YhgE/Pip domain-containing protein n=1 Tax=unclassified Corynebacterium TaxID=2624378 RepID=UPI00118477A0|nr:MULTISPECIES: YhgE/Pip domain-containing protein [unclassified Corynebacterium]MBP3087708.1 YhgE/Pip domain-containing protein [Corynebacterium sp. sy017]QDZ42688.1 YhgE/Pip domain-containing protein [Corynebacterium sp. sy039]TSD92264.1 YhgE/Pip domain-containing protein [Corynebacterium sp. SY003]